VREIQFLTNNYGDSIQIRWENGVFVPESGPASFDHLVGADEQLRWFGKVEHPGGLGKAGAVRDCCVEGRRRELLTVLKPRAVGLLPVCLTMKPVGEPDALIGHVRFDERGWETERCRMAQATAPILDSILFAVQASRPSGPRVRYQRSYSPRVVGGKVMTPGGPAAAA
jgi:hypothetical protein